jgi:hypothetical protein
MTEINKTQASMSSSACAKAKDTRSIGRGQSRKKRRRINYALQELLWPSLPRLARGSSQAADGNRTVGQHDKPTDEHLKITKKKKKTVRFQKHVTHLRIASKESKKNMLQSSRQSE